MWAPNGYHHPIRIGKSICVHFFNICNTQPISCFMLKWNIGTVHFFQRITWSKNCSSLWFLFLRLHSSLLGINSVRKVYQHVTSGLAWGFMFHVALLRPSLCKARRQYDFIRNLIVLCLQKRSQCKISCHETSKTSFNNDQTRVKQELIKLLFDLGNPTHSLGNPSSLDNQLA